MTDLSTKSPAVRMIIKLTEQSFSRLHAGKMQYPTDAETLRNYAKAALKLHEPITAGSVLLTEGLTHMFAGKLDKALDVFKQAYRLFEHQHDFVHLAACTNNVANVYEVRGEFELALDCYRKAQAMVSWMPDDYTTTASILTRGSMLQVLKTNEALISLVLGRYDEAQLNFEQALDMLDGQNRGNLESMLEIRRGLAEVYLAKGNFKAALSSLQLADDIAPTVNNNFLQAGLYFTHAHFTQKIPDYPASSAGFYEQVAALMQDLPTPILYARVLLDEARYQKERGNLETMRGLAQQAHDLFAQLGIDEECRRAAAMLESESA